jgi:NADH-quinone oxidoreductase subunit H
VLSIAPALAAWAVIPFDDGMVLADIDAGLLYILALTSMGVYGVIIAGWASNSKYAFLGAMRSAAQIVAYEIAMGFALVGVLMAAGSLNLGEIVRGPAGQPAALVLAAAAAAVRDLFHLRRGRDQPRAVRRRRGRIGDRRRLPRRVLRHGLRGVLPGRIRQHDPDRGADGDHVPGRLAVAVRGHPGAGAVLFAWVPGIWLAAGKISLFFLFLFLWFRATFPRYRYDQIMRLGWKVFIPMTIVWIVVVGAAMLAGLGPWFD